VKSYSCVSLCGIGKWPFREPKGCFVQAFEEEPHLCRVSGSDGRVDHLSDHACVRHEVRSSNESSSSEGADGMQSKTNRGMRCTLDSVQQTAQAHTHTHTHTCLGLPRVSKRPTVGIEARGGPPPGCRAYLLLERVRGPPPGCRAYLLLERVRGCTDLSTKIYSPSLVLIIGTVLKRIRGTCRCQVLRVVQTLRGLGTDSLTMSKPVPGAMGGAKWGLLGLNALDIDPSSATHRKTARASPTYKKTEFHGKLGIAGEELQGSLPRPWHFPPVISIKVN